MTVVDIARHARVSPATVSRVINQPENVSEERVSAVRRAIKDLDYTPAPLCNRRGPKSRRPAVRSIGLWMIGDPRTSSMSWIQDELIQIQNAGKRRPVDVSICYTETNRDFPKPVRDREFDGIIIQGMEPAPQQWAVFKRLPTVWFLFGRPPGFIGDYVEPDSSANGRMAADYLIARGHRQLVVIDTDPRNCASSEPTNTFVLRGRDAQANTVVISGVPGDRPSLPMPIRSPEEEVEDLVRQWADLNPRPTGVYLPTDQFCGSFLRAARNRHLLPERDFDLILGNRSPLVYPNLIHQPAAVDINLPTLVLRVVDHLLWRIENPGLPGRVGIQISPTLHPAPASSMSFAPKAQKAVRRRPRAPQTMSATLSLWTPSL